MHIGSVIAIKDFLGIYRQIHHGLPKDPFILFRQRLLKFLVAFAKYWSSYVSAVDGNDAHDKLESNTNTRGTISFNEGSKRGDEAPNTVQRPDLARDENLLGLLPSFLALSAVQLSLGGENQITDLWMKLASEYMAHTVVEQVVVFGVRDPTFVDGVFDWKFDEDNAADESTDAFMINAMFFDAEIEGTNARWSEICENFRHTVGSRLSSVTSMN